MAQLIREVRLIMAENGIDPDTGKVENHYKFWNAKLFDDDTVTAEWARVGKTPQTGQWSGGASYLDKKVREKLKKGYTEQKTVGAVTVTSSGGFSVRDADLHQIAKTQLLKRSNPILERLIKRFVEANVHKITSQTNITYNNTTGTFSTPLGDVTPDGLVEARDLLADLAPLVRARQFGPQTDALLCKYLRIIPQSLGMKRFTTETVVPDDNAVQRQSDLIDSLESSYQARQTAPVVAAPGAPKIEQVFKVDLDILADQKERQRIINWFENTKKSVHGYNDIHVVEIFAVNLHSMTNAFENNKVPVHEVWHGTSQANCLSILSTGLRVRPPSTARTAGDLFGAGVYGAPSSSKSLGYTYGKWGQGTSGDTGWLYVCDFAMGRIYDVTPQRVYGSIKGCTCPSGYDSIWARASRDGLYNDEKIVIRNSQVRIKYLLECK